MTQQIRIAVVEDEENERNQILQYLGRYLKENQIEAEVVSYTDGIQIADDYEANFDLIFLDIQMKHMDGLTAAQRIRERDENVILIFIVCPPEKRRCCAAFPAALKRGLPLPHNSLRG